MSINLLPSSGSPAPMSGEDDLRFLYEQARRYVVAKPWEKFANASLHLDLKVGSWHEACAQHISNGPLNALLVFPGRQNMLGLHKAGLAEPPAGTIFVELVAGEPVDGSHEALEHGWPADLTPIPHFKAITPDGWLSLERGQMRLLALALAAISDFTSAASSDMITEVAGEAVMPGTTRGRYRVRHSAADDDGLVPIMGIPRGDLYGDFGLHGFLHKCSLENIPSPEGIRTVLSRR